MLLVIGCSDLVIKENALCKQDAEALEALAKGLSGPSELKPDTEGGELQKKLAAIGERSSKGDFLYTKFFAIGLFRLLELTGAKDPKALESLVSAMNIPQESVSRDLMTYKVLFTTNIYLPTFNPLSLVGEVSLSLGQPVDYNVTLYFCRRSLP